MIISQEAIMKKNRFYQTIGKRIFDLLLSLIGLLVISPLFLLISLLILLDSKSPIIFKQRRVGKNGQAFALFKFRTMVKTAPKLKKKYLPLNEASGPVFKIKHDPRFTRFGQKLAHTGLDELPQLLNVLKGEMSLVGPRPLPVNEEAQIKPKWQKIRRQVKPGLVSSWVAHGAKHDNFRRWMEQDLKDIKKSSLASDLRIIIETAHLVLRSTLHQLRKQQSSP
jgi:lipopolysaccharide/colanic/teichoic acid biosynthesis glycosyltransferase